MKRVILVLLVFIVLLIVALFYFKSSETTFDERKSFLDISSEQSFYKESDLGTDVTKLTNNVGNDGIFYQEPNYFSPDNNYFMFKSERDKRNKLMIIDLETGNMTSISNGAYGWAPSWSNKKNEVYVGKMGKISVIDIESRSEREIEISNLRVATFIHVNPNGDRLLFVEEIIGKHLTLSTIKTDGSDYEVLYALDGEREQYLDHPTFINDNEILFLTRGEGRDFRGDYNRPYIINLNKSIRKLPVECSHYDVNYKDKILCATEGYIIDLEGNKIKELKLRGHGAWHPDGERFLMTGDPIPIPDGLYFGKIVIMNFSNEEITNVVSHENTYDSTIAVHIQPNAQFSRDGNYIIYESDLLRGNSTDLYLVSLN